MPLSGYITVLIMTEPDIIQDIVLDDQDKHPFISRLMQFAPEKLKGKSAPCLVESLFLHPATVNLVPSADSLFLQYSVFQYGHLLITLSPMTTDLARSEAAKALDIDPDIDVHPVAGLSNRIVVTPNEGVLTHDLVQDILRTLYRSSFLTKENVIDAASAFGIEAPAIGAWNQPERRAKYIDPKRPQRECLLGKQRNDFLLYFLSNRAMAKPASLG